MPRTVVPVTALSRDGVAPAAPAAADAVNGNAISNDGRSWVEVTNADGAASHTITFLIPGTVDSQPVGDRAEVVPQSASRRYGPFPVSVYGLTLEMTVDSAQLELAAYSLPTS